MFGDKVKLKMTPEEIKIMVYVKYKISDIDKMESRDIV